MDVLNEEIHGGRYRFDRNHGSNQFTFIERRRYRELVDMVKKMGLDDMLTVLGPKGFSFAF